MALKAVYHTNLTDTWTNAADGDPKGGIRMENGIWYKCVEVDEGAGALTHDAGDVVGYVSSGYDTHMCTGDVSDTDAVGAGVLLADLDDLAAATNVFCWIQLTGHMTLNTSFFSATTAGQTLFFGIATGDLTLDVVSAATQFAVATSFDDANDEIIGHFPF